MRPQSCFAFLLCSLLALPALAEPPTPTIPSLSNDQVNRLNNGEILVDLNTDATPIGEAIGIVDAPAQQVYDIVADFPRQKEWIEDCTEAEVVGQEGEAMLTRGTTDTPWPMSDRNWTTRTYNSQREIEGMQVWVSAWDYVAGSGNIENTEGYWLFIPWGDDGTKTLVVYHMLFDLGTDMPDFLINWATENMLPTRIQALRGQVQ